jgi:ribosomal protein S17
MPKRILTGKVVSNKAEKNYNSFDREKDNASYL